MFQYEHKQKLVEKEEELVFRDMDVSQKPKYSKKKKKSNKWQNQYFNLRTNAVMQQNPTFMTSTLSYLLTVTDQYNFVDSVLIVKAECSFFNKDSIKLFFLVK